MSLSIPALVFLVLLAYRAPALSGSGITDPDYYWHVAYGEWIVQHGHLPTADWWSWTFEGHDYRLTQWLGEVVMAVANAAGGLAGTSTLAALLVTLTMVCSYRTARLFLDNRLAALAVAIGCNAMLVSLACRPHQFTHLGLSILTWIVSSYLAGNRRALWWTPPLMALWVNLHGGYAFGLVYLGMVSAFVAAEAYMEQSADRLRAVCIPLAIATAAAAFATLLNPYGWGAWSYAVEIASLQSSSSGIVDEWAATSVKTEVGLNFFAVSAAVFGAMAASSRRPSFYQLLLAVSLCAIGWSAVRLSLMTTVLMVPLLAAAFRHTSFYALAFDGDARRHDRKVAFVPAVAIVTVSLSASIWLSSNNKATLEHVAGSMPVAEAQFMADKKINGRLLNPPETGGFLMRKHGFKVSMDTRLDLYGDRALFSWIFANRGADGWRSYIEQHDPDVVLVNNMSSLRGLLVDFGMYRPVFEGPSYTVLVRASEHPELPSVALGNPSAKALQLLKS